MEQAVSDTLETALQAARLLGRWSLVGQRHGGGWSCCPGLGDISMTDVEAHMLKSLRTQHALLQNRESFISVLRDCVKRTPIDGAQPEELESLFKDIGDMIEHLENIQRGLF